MEDIRITGPKTRRDRSPAAGSCALFLAEQAAAQPPPVPIYRCRNTVSTIITRMALTSE